MAKQHQDKRHEDKKHEDKKHKGKKHDKQRKLSRKHGKGEDATLAPGSVVPLGEPQEKLAKKEYKAALYKLHAELVELQEWVKATGYRAVVVFEGRDAAGKGGVIKAITERVSPRVFRTVALPTPSEREKTQLYLQRYVTQFPAAGEVVLFDRSWYNRAGVERVMGFCSRKEYENFLEFTPTFEDALVRAGIHLVKYWFEVSMDEQQRRFQSRIEDPRKIWKLSPMDLESYNRWYQYSRARDAMFAATDVPEAPWYIVPADDKRRARLNCITHLLGQIPYEKVKRKKIALGERELSDRYDDLASFTGRRFVPDVTVRDRVKVEQVPERPVEPEAHPASRSSAQPRAEVREVVVPSSPPERASRTSAGEVPGFGSSSLS